LDTSERNSRLARSSMAAVCRRGVQTLVRCFSGLRARGFSYSRDATQGDSKSRDRKASVNTRDVQLSISISDSAQCFANRRLSIGARNELVGGASIQSSRKLMRLGGHCALTIIPAQQPLTDRQAPHLDLRLGNTARNVTMSSSRIYHNISKIPITSTLVLIWGNYELWRIHKGIHPYWSPRLEAAGYTKKRQDATLEAPGNGAGGSGAVGAKVEASSGGVSIQWMNLNGVPIPFIAGKSVD
jgi:hypothetical protein